MVREDWVEGRARRVETLQRWMFRALVEPDGGKYLAQTGSFLMSKNLRSKSTRAAFSILMKAEAEAVGEGDARECRFWTKKLVRDAIWGLVTEKNLSVPQLPGFSWAEWLKHNAKIIHDLAQKAKRNEHDRLKSMSSIDAMDTVPYEPTAVVEDPCIFFADQGWKVSIFAGIDGPSNTSRSRCSRQDAAARGQVLGHVSLFLTPVIGVFLSRLSGAAHQEAETRC